MISPPKGPEDLVAIFRKNEARPMKKPLKSV